MFRIGSHTHYDKDNGLLGVVKESISYGSNTFMFYTGSNQSTLRYPINEPITYEAHKLMKENGFDSSFCFVHAPFIINLANNSDESKYNFYISFLKQEISRCISLGINNLVLHPGSAVSVPRISALVNVANGLNMALKDINNFNILLEFMAGKGTEVGTTIEEMKIILDNVEKQNQVYICLDTCHLNDSGVNLNNFDDFLEEFNKIIGIDKIKCIHINDSKNIISSHKDRHENIGYGTIGFDTLMNVIYNNKLIDVPKILETPYVNDYPPYKEEIINIKSKRFIDYIKDL